MKISLFCVVVGKTFVIFSELLETVAAAGFFKFLVLDSIAWSWIFIAQFVREIFHSQL